jgi:NAD(P)-dependent dehydrogenase (short-subunit alcohol dehydrogenase family)
MGRRASSSTAGISTPIRVVSRDGTPAPLADFEKVIRVNLIGAFNMIRLAAASMGKARTRRRRARRHRLDRLRRGL